MIRNTASRLRLALAACVGLLFTAAATAGPPLICHPLDAGNAALLPWGQGNGWNSPDPRYDTANLARDTLRLLSADAPVLARMENLRRAVIYSAGRPQVATGLFDGLMARAAAGPRNWRAWFDAAYLIEAYRQARFARLGDVLSTAKAPPTDWPELAALDGYRMLGTLAAREGASAEVEFARSLMALDEQALHGHLRRAQQLASGGSLLARNVAAFAN